VRITQHFRSEEFDCRDGTAYPARWIESRLRPLCEQLELIRAELGGRGISITSGFRTPEYNRSIGGARASQHMDGRAADFVVAGRTPQIVHDRVLAMYNAELLEIGGLGLYPRFTHIDVRQGDRLARWGGSRIES